MTGNKELFCLVQVLLRLQFYPLTSPVVYTLTNLLNILFFYCLLADDISLYIIVDNPIQAAGQLYKNMAKIHR